MKDRENPSRAPPWRNQYEYRNHCTMLHYRRKHAHAGR